jgi:hypothetical protein
VGTGIPVDEQGRESVTDVPVVLSTVGEGAQRLADDAVAKARKTALVNLGSWSTINTSGKPSPERWHMSRMMSAASAAVAVARVGTA